MKCPDGSGKPFMHTEESSTDVEASENDVSADGGRASDALNRDLERAFYAISAVCQPW